MKIAVFCSGNGSNLQAIINASRSGRLPCEIAVVVSDNKNAYALNRARRSGIETIALDPRDYDGRDAFDAGLIRIVSARKVSLIVLAGYMRILGGSFIKRYRNRIMNIHPSLLPAFKGSDAAGDALRYGAKVTGPTVHFVDEKIDHGPIIIQKAIAVKEGENKEALLKRIHKEEHKIYPEAIRMFAEGRLKVKGRRVVIK